MIQDYTLFGPKLGPLIDRPIIILRAMSGPNFGPNKVYVLHQSCRSNSACQLAVQCMKRTQRMHTRASVTRLKTHRTQMQSASYKPSKYTTHPLAHWYQDYYLPPPCEVVPAGLILQKKKKPHHHTKKIGPGALGVTPLGFTLATCNSRKLGRGCRDHCG